MAVGRRGNSDDGRWTIDHGPSSTVNGPLMTKILAIIPARGGSKGIPRKNIRSFAGYPLIAWSIAAAKRSSLVTRVIVSTDDEEIAAVAREWGAETPFLRPAELAQDKTTDLPVFEHALKWLEEVEGYRPGFAFYVLEASFVEGTPSRPIAINSVRHGSDVEKHQSADILHVDGQ